MSLKFYYDFYRRDLTNLSFLKYRMFEGFIVTMHQSGTHWLKHILACAIARDKNLQPPQYTYASDMIGGHKDPVKYPGIPMFGHSHSIPSILILSGLLRKIVRQPRYVILVRDLRNILVSHYEKYKHEYKCNFSDYLRGDVSNRRFGSDIWWCIRFQNAWGRVLEKYPDKCLLMKYEHLMADTLQEIKNINNFLGLNLSDDALSYGVEESTKDKMKAKPLKPAYKMKKKHNRVVVRTDSGTYDKLFSDDDLSFFNETCKKFLKHDFGYKY